MPQEQNQNHQFNINDLMVKFFLDLMNEEENEGGQPQDESLDESPEPVFEDLPNYNPFVLDSEELSQVYKVVVAMMGEHPALRHQMLNILLAMEGDNSTSQFTKEGKVNPVYLKELHLIEERIQELLAMLEVMSFQLA